ncbi:MAG: UDP-N-acetylmuramoyl-L-alanine--D-glutamate ligase [bacterium]
MSPADPSADQPAPLDVAGRTVLVAGVRVAGAAVARVLLERGARVRLADADPAGAGPALDDLVRAGARFVGDPTDVPTDVDLVVTSPGLRLDHPLARAARVAGRPVIGEVELAWRMRPADAAPWLAVTGTNGKTTTVNMLTAVLGAAGRRTRAVGNVGVPVIEAALDPAYDVLAVELSSFQLAWSPSVRPAAGALLNLAPDHLDWHGSMDAYAKAKAGVWAGPVAVGNADDPSVAMRLAAAAAPTRVTFTVTSPEAGQLGVVDGELVDRAFGSPADPTGTVLLPAVDVHPAGQHNVANALAAAALARAYGVKAEEVADGLRAFVPDPHRFAAVGTVDGVHYVDDSKATNPHAAAAALAAARPVVWIAGGQLKGVDIDPLVGEIAAEPGHLAGVVLLGVDRARIATALARHAPDVPVIDVASGDDEAMVEVVRAARRLARPGYTVLLSPAAASYDMFTDYADRGRRFAAAVRALTPSSSGPPDASTGKVANRDR